MTFCPWCGLQAPTALLSCTSCGTDFAPYHSAVASGARRKALPSRFWRQLTASAISNVGDGITLGALPLLAILLTRDSRLIGGVAFVSLFPWVLFALPVGVVVDKYDRRSLLIGANVARGLVLVVLCLSTAAGWTNIWMLYCALFLLGTAEVLFDSCAHAFLPSLVDSEQLERANGLLSLTETFGARFVGMPLGALLFAVAVGLPFGVDAASFAITVALLTTIRVSVPASLPRHSARVETYRFQILDGVRRLWRHHLLRTLVVLLGIVNFAGYLGLGTFVQFAIETLHVQQRWYGALLALMAFGALLGGLLGSRVVRKLGRSQSIVLSYVLLGLCPIGTGLANNFATVAFFSLVEAFAVTLWNIVTMSLRQRIIPTGQFGRINGVFRWIGFGSMAFGALLGGVLAHQFGLRAPFVIGGTIILFASVYAAVMLTPARVNAGETLPWAVV